MIQQNAVLTFTANCGIISLELYFGGSFMKKIMLVIVVTFLMLFMVACGNSKIVSELTRIDGDWVCDSCIFDFSKDGTFKVYDEDYNYVTSGEYKIGNDEITLDFTQVGQSRTLNYTFNDGQLEIDEFKFEKDISEATQDRAEEITDKILEGTYGS